MAARWLLVMVCVLALCPRMAAVPGTLGATAAWAAPADDDDDDPEQTKAEIEIGREASKLFEKRMKIISSGPAVDKLKIILKRLAANSGRPGLPYSVKIVDSPMVNAATFPGGKIYVFKGLLNQNLDDSALAGILGHEVVHAARSHGYRKLLEMKALGVITGSGSMVSEMTKVVLLNGFGRTYENQADKYAVRIAAKAGYDPNGMVRALQMLQKIDRDDHGLITGLVATHPPIAERIKKVKAEIKAMGK